MKTKGSKKTAKKTATKAKKKSPAKKVAVKKAAAKPSKGKVGAKAKAKPVAAPKKTTKKPAKNATPVKLRAVKAPTPKAAAPKASASKKPVAPKLEAVPSPKPAPVATPTAASVVEAPPAVVVAKPENGAARPKSILRIAGGRVRGGDRSPTNGAGAASGMGSGFGPHAAMSGATAEASMRMPGGRLEVNPRLESTRGKIKTPPPAAMVNQSTVKGMSVAEKRRAEAEAMFQQYAKPGSVPAPAPAAPAPGQNGTHAANAGVDEYGRFSHRDSLMTMLRMASHRAQALEAANELASKYKLPADQGLLLKVLDLGEARLTKLALEELIELDDRGRVRPNDQLRASLAGVETHDPETQELKDLLMAKVGVRV